MRLLKTRPAAQEELTDILNDGYRLLNAMNVLQSDQQGTGTWNPSAHIVEYADHINRWGARVLEVLGSIFPTDRECNNFVNPPGQGLRTATWDNEHEYKWVKLRFRLQDLLHALDTLIETRLDAYTDLPITARIFIEDIDSFHKVRDINPAMVADVLDERGYLEVSEEEIQLFIERVLDETLHKKHWGGEQNDLYTANLKVNGRRVSTAFLLKGNGLRRKVMRLADCGSNGDQTVRLAKSPADLLIIQHVGNVSEAVISDIEGKVEQARLAGRDRWYCIINGQDLARLMRAYGAS